MNTSVVLTRSACWFSINLTIVLSIWQLFYQYDTCSINMTLVLAKRKLLTNVLSFGKYVIPERRHVKMCNGTWLLYHDLDQKTVHYLSGVHVDRVVVVPSSSLKQFIIGQNEGHFTEGRDIYRYLELICVSWSERSYSAIRRPYKMVFHHIIPSFAIDNLR